jgi:hypothetical protein
MLSTALGAVPLRLVYNLNFCTRARLWIFAEHDAQARYLSFTRRPFQMADP